MINFRDIGVLGAGVDPNTLTNLQDPTGTNGAVLISESGETWVWNEVTDLWVMMTSGSGADKFHSNIVGTAPYDPLLPLSGWVAPSSPIAGNTVEVKFTDGTVGSYTWDGSAWIPDFQQTWAEQRICLNTATPTFTPLDASNPTILEVEAWKNANLSLLDQQNGTILTYYDPTPIYTIQPTLTINNQNLGASTYDYRVTSCIINGTEFATTPIDIVLANVYVYNNSLSTAIRNYFTANNIIGNVDDGSFTSFMDLIFYGVQGTTLNVSMTVEYSLVSTPTTFVTSTKTGVSNAVIAPQLYSCEEPLITYVLSDGDLITRTSSPSGIFYKEQSVVDAGTDKYAKVYRYGSIGIGMNKPKAPLHIYGIGDHFEPNLSDASIYLGGHGKKIYWGDNTKTPESGSNVHNLSLGEWNGDSDALAYHAKTGHRFYVKATAWDDNSSSQYPTFFIRNSIDFTHNVGKIGLNTNSPRVSVDFGKLTNPDGVIANKDGMIIPGGTIAERPSTPVESTIRYNSDSKCIEYYDGVSWKSDCKPYKIYTALLSQTGTNNPTVIVLENTLGESITWTRVGVGLYRGTTTSNIFTIDKTYYSPVVAVSSTQNYPPPYNTYDALLLENSPNDIHLESRFNGILSDDALHLATIEIRVYP